MEIVLFLKILLLAAILPAGLTILYIIIFNKNDLKDKKIIFLIITALAFLTLFFLIRAWLKNFFPFTDKIESFAVLFFLLMASALYYRDKLNPEEFNVLLVLGIASGLTAFLFTDKLKYPSPYLLTVWYPLHVPLSFAAYAFWFASGIRSLFIMLTGKGDSMFVTDMNKKGFIVFTTAMIFGGIWGYVAWGAYFMWDPKILWSVILWVYYGNLLHIDGIASYRKLKHPLYFIGIFLILVTFIGTGFFTRSIHRF